RRGRAPDPPPATSRRDDQAITLYRYFDPARRLRSKAVWKIERRTRGRGSRIEDRRLKIAMRVMMRSSILDPRSSILDPRSSILDPRSSILDPRSSILDPRSSILDPRSSILIRMFSVPLSPFQKSDIHKFLRCPPSTPILQLIQNHIRVFARVFDVIHSDFTFHRRTVN